MTEDDLDLSQFGELATLDVRAERAEQISQLARDNFGRPPGLTRALEAAAVGSFSTSVLVWVVMKVVALLS